jgi:exosome complex component RRP42
MSVTPHSSIIAKVEHKTLTDLIERDKRLDDRSFTEYRNIKLETGLIEKANGSAFIELGNTKVLVGIKVTLEEPFSDTPDKGKLTVTAELVPVASPLFEPGPPNENAIELARIVDRGIRESEAIDLHELCLLPGKQVIVIFIDIYVLDNDGNLIDASAIASLAALLTTKIPKYVVKKNEQIETKDKMVPLNVVNHPITITTAKIGNSLIFDPTYMEEQLIDSRLTMTIDNNNNICATQKGGLGALSISEIKSVLHEAISQSSKIRSKIFEEIKVG